MKKELLTQIELKTLLSYNKDTGQFCWLGFDPLHLKDKGKKAGYIGERGYTRIKINNKLYRAHRLVWLYVYGHWPKHEIDHINGDKSDNRLINLRDVPKRINRQNQIKPMVDNRTGFLGVSVRKRDGKYIAQIGCNGKSVYLGSYDSPIKAHARYIQAKIDMHAGNTLRPIKTDSLFINKEVA